MADMTTAEGKTLRGSANDRFKKTSEEVDAYNQRRLGPPSTPEMVALFNDRLASLAPGRTDLTTLWDLTELDDNKSFGLA